MRGRRGNGGPASVKTAALTAAVALLLLAGLGTAAPLDSKQPLIQAAFAYPLSAVDGWQLMAGWSAPMRESGLIACVGSGLLAAASFVRRAL
jgi:hypothetical protein